MELLTNQANLESIAAQAIGYTNECPEGEAARNIDTDWMYSFAAYAERVSDEHMQKLWAKILAKSATPTQPRITPVALQTMSLINKETALDFQKFCSVVLAFGFYPTHDDWTNPEEEVQNIDLLNLKDIGLVQDGTVGFEYNFPGFSVISSTPNLRLKLVRTSVSLTKRGADIGNIVFDQGMSSLANDVRLRYMRSVITTQIKKHYGVTIVPSAKR